MDDQGNSNLLDNIMKLFVLPEIERRRMEGRLSDKFELRAAQVILNVAAGDAEIRLNSEVKARAVFKVDPQRTFDAGDPVTEADVEGVDSIVLQPEDADAGHITLIKIRDLVHISFDFRRNRSRIQRHLEVARQFLDAAIDAAERGRLNVFGDTLFSAVELMTKAWLFSIPKGEYVRSRKHEYFRSEFNILGRNGVADTRFVQLLNELSKLRERARYLAAPLQLDEAEVKRFLEIAEEMFREAHRGA